MAFCGKTELSEVANDVIYTEIQQLKRKRFLPIARIGELIWRFRRNF